MNHQPFPNNSSSRLRVAVIIATKGRPQAATKVLRFLEKQTHVPEIVLFSAHSQKDVEQDIESPLNREYIFESGGLPFQRNGAIRHLNGRVDIIIFFDDNFVPSPYWIERCLQLFNNHPNVVGLDGTVVLDGATGIDVSWEQAESAVAAADSPDLQAYPITNEPYIYGCNMAYRLSAIENIHFDERMIFGRLEDRDFSVRVSRVGQLIRSGSMFGAHLGMRSGRVSGKRMGFAQVINAWYLYDKGVLSKKEAWLHSVKALLSNSVKSLWRDVKIDRRGRLIGNLIGFKDLLTGSCQPENVRVL